MNTGMDLQVFENVLRNNQVIGYMVELVSKELNHLAAILHVYAGGLIFMKKKNVFFKKKIEIL